MAALPTDIVGTAMISSAIGVGSNNVGTLFLHNNVNEYGFNPPGTNNFNAVWGKPPSERAKLSPNNPNYAPIVGILPGYAIGYFRRYDHDWVVYMSGGVEQEIDTYYDPIILTFVITRPQKLLSKPSPSPAIQHTFKVEFARDILDFGSGNAYVLNEGWTISEPGSSIQIHLNFPPDYSDNGIIEKGETFFVRFIHLSSPERRWFGGGEPFLAQVTAPTSLYTDTYDIRNVMVVAVDRLLPTALTIFTIEADLWADYGEQKTMNFSASMSDSSDFIGNVFTVSLPTVTVPINSTPGTKTYVQNLGFNLTNSGIKDYVNIGNTVYYRIMKDGVIIKSGSTIVTDTPPIE